MSSRAKFRLPKRGQHREQWIKLQPPIIQASDLAAAAGGDEQLFDSILSAWMPTAEGWARALAARLDGWNRFDVVPRLTSVGRDAVASAIAAYDGVDETAFATATFQRMQDAIRGALHGDDVIVNHLMAVCEGTIAHYARQYQGRVPFDDLMQVGVFGVKRALLQYDPFIAAFTTWSQHAIRDEIQKEAGRYIERPLTDDERKLRRLKDQFLVENGRDPTEQEMTDALGWPMAKTIRVRAGLRSYTGPPRSLEELEERGEREPGWYSPVAPDNPEREATKQLFRRLMAEIRLELQAFDWKADLILTYPGTIRELAAVIGHKENTLTQYKKRHLDGQRARHEAGAHHPSVAGCWICFVEQRLELRGWNVNDVRELLELGSNQRSAHGEEEHGGDGNPETNRGPEGTERSADAGEESGRDA